MAGRIARFDRLSDGVKKGLPVEKWRLKCCGSFVTRGRFRWCTRRRRAAWKLTDDLCVTFCKIGVGVRQCTNFRRVPCKMCSLSDDGDRFAAEEIGRASCRE